MTCNLGHRTTFICYATFIIHPSSHPDVFPSHYMCIVSSTYRAHNDRVTIYMNGCNACILCYGFCLEATIKRRPQIYTDAVSETRSFECFFYALLNSPSIPWCVALGREKRLCGQAMVGKEERGRRREEREYIGERERKTLH